MKKTLLVIVTLIGLLALGACNNAPSAEQQRLDELEARIAEIEWTLDNLGIVEGLNGQREYYIIPQDNETAGTLFQRINAETIILKDTLDKNTAPSYILDEKGNYISFEDLGKLLKAKYYGSANSRDDIYLVGFQAKMRIRVINEDMELEEFIARTIMLIQELENYKFYILSSSELYLQLYFNAESFEIKIPLATMLADFITITPDGIYDQDYEIKVNFISFNKTSVQTYYDDFILNETFTGYVLDYN